MSENSPENPEYPEYKMPAGAKSLIQFLLVMGTAIPAFMWESARPYAGGDGDGTNFLMGFLLFFFWFPMLLASLMYGIIGIADNKGRVQGLIVVSIIGVIVLWAIIDSIVRYAVAA